MANMTPKSVLKAKMAQTQGFLVSGCAPMTSHYSTCGIYERHSVRVSTACRCLKAKLPVDRIGEQRARFSSVQFSQVERPDTVSSFRNATFEPGSATEHNLSVQLSCNSGALRQAVRL